MLVASLGPAISSITIGAQAPCGPTFTTSSKHASNSQSRTSKQNVGHQFAEKRFLTDYEIWVSAPTTTTQCYVKVVKERVRNGGPEVVGHERSKADEKQATKAWVGIGNKRNASETAEAVALEKSEAASEREARQAVKASRRRGRELEADDKAAAKAAAEAAAKAKATEGRAARTKAAAAAAAEAATNRAPPWKERPAGWPEKEDTDEGSEVDSEAEGEEMIEVGAYVWAKDRDDKSPTFGDRIRGSIRAAYKRQRAYTVTFYDYRLQEDTPEDEVQRQAVGDDGDEEARTRTARRGRSQRGGAGCNSTGKEGDPS
jgi:hypothetical protein